MIRESIYGHSKRLSWILSHLRKGDFVVEVGCGTGSMITLPLCEMGFRVLGIDSDERSIAFGKELLRHRGFKPDILRVGEITELDMSPDVLIASEVIEHLSDEEVPSVMNTAQKRLGVGGKFLVTVPNGYGWFELESFFWYRAKLGFVIERTQMDSICRVVKRFLLGPEVDNFTPSTLSDSSHVQRFTFRSIQQLLLTYGFEVIDRVGSVLIAGPFSNLLFTGLKPIMSCNNVIGSKLPRLAAGFFIGCRLTRKP